MPQGARVDGSTTFSLEVVLLLVSLAFNVGVVAFMFRDSRRRLDRLEKTTIRKHWFRNWAHLFQSENQRIKVPDPDEIKSQD